MPQTTSKNNLFTLDLRGVNGDAIRAIPFMAGARRPLFGREPHLWQVQANIVRVQMTVRVHSYAHSSLRSRLDTHTPKNGLGNTDILHTHPQMRVGIYKKQKVPKT